MKRRPPPPRTLGLLERLFDRLADEASRCPIDPDLGRRVEAEITARIRAGRTTLPAGSSATARHLPVWAAVAAGVLLALGVGASSAPGGRGSLAPPTPLPQEAPRDALAAPPLVQPQAPDTGDRVEVPSPR